MDEHLATVTLTVAFGYEGEQTEEQIKEMALEWIGTTSDRHLAQGMSVEIDPA